MDKTMGSGSGAVQAPRSKVDMLDTVVERVQSVLSGLREVSGQLGVNASPMESAKTPDTPVREGVVGRLDDLDGNISRLCDECHHYIEDIRRDLS